MLLPYGGLVVSRSLNQVSVASYSIAAPTRSVSRPSPCGFHTRPAGGAKFAILPFHIASGIPESPLKKRPGGAVGFTVLRWPARKADMLNEVPRPYLSGSGKVGSQRNPKLSMSVLEILKLSCA